MNTHPKLHTDMVKLRISPELREGFADLCQAHGISFSEAIRLMISRAIAEGDISQGTSRTLCALPTQENEFTQEGKRTSI